MIEHESTPNDSGPCSIEQQSLVGDAMASGRRIQGSPPLGGATYGTTSSKLMKPNQYMFIQRIIFLHQVASRRAGRASTVKLSVSEWCTECDSMCVFTHTLQEMHRACDDSGNRLFSEDLLGNIKNRGLEGYLH